MIETHQDSLSRCNHCMKQRASRPQERTFFSLVVMISSQKQTVGDIMDLTTGLLDCLFLFFIFSVRKTIQVLIKLTRAYVHGVSGVCFPCNRFLWCWITYRELNEFQPHMNPCIIPYPSPLKYMLTNTRALQLKGLCL